MDEGSSQRRAGLHVDSPGVNVDDDDDVDSPGEEAGHDDGLHVDDDGDRDDDTHWDHHREDLYDHHHYHGL